jgi:pimeloyl-ACP methyl ester carboxylesterase
VGLSFGGSLAIAFAGRRPELAGSLVLASAYAGWARSLPSGAAEQRLAQAERLSTLTPDDLVATLLPTMFCAMPPAETLDRFEVSLRAVRPAGFRALARASADNVRDALARIRTPTLLVYGDADVRAPRAIAEDLHAAIAGSQLVVLPGVGHCCNLEAPKEFNLVVRRFLRAASESAL